MIGAVCVRERGGGEKQGGRGEGKGKGKGKVYLGTKTYGNAGNTADSQQGRYVNTDDVEAGQGPTAQDSPGEEGADGNKHTLQVSPFQPLQLQST
jgi:hypothetical protein